jgi:hypothetical protein
MKHAAMRLSVIVVLTVLALTLALVPLSAQEATPESTTGTFTQCDSALITLLLIARRDYGYEVSTETGLDLNTFEYGQYNRYFTDLDMMSGMEGGTEGSMEATAEATAEGMTGTESMTTEATADPMGDMPMITLLPGDVVGEDLTCTQLRADLVQFFMEEFENPSGGMMGEDGAAG